MSPREHVKSELKELVEEGMQLSKRMNKEEDYPVFASSYQIWYTRALPLVKALASDRLEEFRRYYEADVRRKGIDATSYSIQDFVSGLGPVANSLGETPYDPGTAAYARFINQIWILSALQSRVDTVLEDVEGHLLADLEDRELVAASALSKQNLRAAGALAGVVLERHLGHVLKNRAIKISKAHPSISDLNETLKREGVYDLPVYRKIQLMADLRNICCHSKGREPSPVEVDDLIAGVATIVKTVF